jgi:hypothetical protein
MAKFQNTDDTDWIDQHGFFNREQQCKSFFIRVIRVLKYGNAEGVA